MPKKAKDNLIDENKVVEIKSTTKSKSNKTKGTSSKSPSTSAKAKNASEKCKSTSAKAKNTSTKTSTKKSASKVATKKSTSKKSISKKNKIVEYYDLPNSYNQTIVKILAQTPSILFVYWDISLENKQNLINTYGESFFNNTIPFLVVTNQTKNYSFEVEINDYANSWYIHIPDSNCKYDVSLIRKQKNNEVVLPNGYVYITNSNNLEVPNDHILFEQLGKMVFFKNIKNNAIIEKDISSFTFMHNVGKIYNIYEWYKEIYKDELEENILGIGLSSSQFR